MTPNKNIQEIIDLITGYENEFIGNIDKLEKMKKSFITKKLKDQNKKQRKLLTEEEKEEHKKKNQAKFNAMPEYKEKRRINANKHYERKKLAKYIKENGSDKGFNYKYLEPTDDE